MRITVATLSRLVRDPRAGYKQSLSVLEQAKKSVPGMVTKSSIMLGCGETDHQVLKALSGMYGGTKTATCWVLEVFAKKNF